MKEKSENKNIFLDPKMINSRNLTDTAPLSGFIMYFK